MHVRRPGRPWLFNVLKVSRLSCMGHLVSQLMQFPQLVAFRTTAAEQLLLAAKQRSSRDSSNAWPATVRRADGSTVAARRYRRCVAQRGWSVRVRSRRRLLRGKSSSAGGAARPAGLDEHQQCARLNDALLRFAQATVRSD